MHVVSAAVVIVLFDMFDGGKVVNQTCLKSLSRESSANIARLSRTVLHDMDVKEDTVLAEPSAADTATKKICQRKTAEVTPGILYLSRIPVFMKPRHIQHIFCQYGDLGRTFLQPEEKFTHRTGKKSKNKSLGFSEGWIEYKNKKIAKRVALTLNNTRISGRKRSRYYDDLWCIKYLHKFQWSHLAGQLQFEQQVQKQRVRAEIMQSKKETSMYLKNVEESERLDRMQCRKAKQGKTWTHRTREYRQNSVIEHQRGKRMSGKVTGSVLSKIFAKDKTQRGPVS